MNSLREAVRDHGGLCEELPLVHTSRCEVLPEILSSHTLEPQPCSVFDECLLYFFYGRPAYRPRNGLLPGHSSAVCPICFVLRPRAVSKDVARVFPCDSGALHGDLFGPEVISADGIRLELDPTIDAIQRYVDLFFSSNGRYYLGKVPRRSRTAVPPVVALAGAEDLRRQAFGGGGARARAGEFAG